MPSISLAFWKKLSPPSAESSPVFANSIGSTISQLSGVSHARTSGISLKLRRGTRHGGGADGRGTAGGQNLRRYIAVITSRLLPHGYYFAVSTLRLVPQRCVPEGQFLPNGYYLMVITLWLSPHGYLLTDITSQISPHGYYLTINTPTVISPTPKYLTIAR